MASLSYQLRDIYSEIQLLKEIGEGNAKPYQFSKRSSMKYTFMARLAPNQKEEVKVDFQDLDIDPSLKSRVLANVFDRVKTAYNVGFKVNENEFQLQKGEMGPFLRIMSTISLIIQDFINNHDPDLIFLYGTPREFGTDDDRKNVLYKVFINKQLNKISDYDTEERAGGHVIYKKGLKGSIKNKIN